MSVFLLCHHDTVTVGTDQLVFSAAQTGALQDIVAQAARIQSLHDAAEQRLGEAEQAGFDAGHARGLEAGRAEARDECLRQINEHAEQLSGERARVRESAVRLALDIVRAIANELGSDAMLGALARSAALQLLPSESATLRLNPVDCDGVKRRLDTTAKGGMADSAIIDVVADDSLQRGACVLTTETGQVLADLETQLRIIESRVERHGRVEH